MKIWLNLKKNNPKELVLIVKAKPKASQSDILGENSDATALEVMLAAPPVDGVANFELTCQRSKIRASKVAKHKIYE